LKNGCGRQKFLVYLAENNYHKLATLNTGARWPNFRPNNSKQALKNCPWPEKIGGRKIAEFGKKWQKRGRKIFLQIFRWKTV
jgi:hypothetical protein